MQEAVAGRKFHLSQRMPGATRNTSDFSAEATSGQAGVAKSMLSMTWNSLWNSGRSAPASVSRICLSVLLDVILLIRVSTLLV